MHKDCAAPPVDPWDMPLSWHVLDEPSAASTEERVFTTSLLVSALTPVDKHIKQKQINGRAEPHFIKTLQNGTKAAFAKPLKVNTNLFIRALIQYYQGAGFNFGKNIFAYAIPFYYLEFAQTTLQKHYHYSERSAKFLAGFMIGCLQTFAVAPLDTIWALFCVNQSQSFKQILRENKQHLYAGTGAAVMRNGIYWSIYPIAEQLLKELFPWLRAYPNCAASFATIVAVTLSFPSDTLCQIARAKKGHLSGLLKDPSIMNVPRLYSGSLPCFGRMTATTLILNSADCFNQKTPELQ